MNDIRTMLQQAVDAGELPGAVAVVGHAGSAEATVVGIQSLESGSPMTRRSLFHWDSLSKPLTAALALTFVAQGRLELTSPISRWLPELSSPRVLRTPSAQLDDSVPADRPVTVEDLLTSRGGLGFTSNFESPLVGALVEQLQEGFSPRTIDRETFLSSAGRLPLAHQPGRGWTYNLGSTVLGLLLERVADAPLDDLMQKRVFDPLEMHDARWWVPEADWPRFTSRYDLTGTPPHPVELRDPPSGAHSRPPSFPDGASGIIGTADDWLNFGTMLATHGAFRDRVVLPAPLVRAMMTDQLTPDQRRMGRPFLPDGEGWGYGGSVRRDGTFGWSGGAGTSARVDAARGRVAILLTQVALEGPEGSRTLSAFEALTSPSPP